MIKDEHGGLNWPALPLICGWLGVTNFEELMPRLAVIKLHRSNPEGQP